MKKSSIRKFFIGDTVLKDKHQVKQVVLRSMIIVIIVLLVNALMNYNGQHFFLVYSDIIGVLTIVALLLFKRKIPLRFSALFIYSIVILMNYITVEVIGNNGGNLFFFLVIPMGFSLIFQRSQLNYSLVMFLCSGLLLFLSMFWNNPLIPGTDVGVDYLQHKRTVNILLSFALTGIFIYRYVYFYQHINQKLKDDIAEKQTLLSEIHHRVKNNLNVIIAMIQLQQMDFEDEKQKSYLKTLESRIYTIAKVHESLYNKNKVEGRIHLGQYTQSLAEDVIYSLNTGIELVPDMQIDETVAIDDAVPIGLIVNELLANSIEHSFREASGTIYLSLKHREDGLIMTYSDTGLGFDFDKAKTTSFGLTLVETLIEQLDGTMNYDRKTGYTFIWQSKLEVLEAS